MYVLSHSSFPIDLCATSFKQNINYKIQKTSSIVNWTGKKVLGLHKGNINISDNFIEITDDNLVGGEIQIDMTSITISDIEDKKPHDDFLAHLKNADFFAVDQFNIATLIISSSEKLQNNRFRINGTLTIKDISSPISFITSIEIFTNTLHSLGELVID